MEEEIFYIGKVQDRRYAVMHEVPNVTTHWNLSLSFDGLAGYLEGATALHYGKVNLNNGIPFRMMRETGNSQDVDVRQLDNKTLDRLLTASCLKGSKFQLELTSEK